MRNAHAPECQSRSGVFCRMQNHKGDRRMRVRKFKPGERTSHGARMLVPANCPRIVIAADPEHILRVWLHWQGKVSIPCQGDDCEFCAAPPFAFAYVPCYVSPLKSEGITFVEKVILPVTSINISRFDVDFTGYSWAVAVRGKRGAELMTLQKVELIDKDKYPWWDVEIELTRLWKMRFNAMGNETPKQPDLWSAQKEALKNFIGTEMKGPTDSKRM